MGFPRRNWAIVIVLRVLIEVAYGITIPSMHQFITTPARADANDSRTVSGGGRPQESELTVSPGFGQSEVFFTSAVVVYSVGELNGALLSPLFIRLLPYRWFFFLGTTVCTIGFLLYALAPSVWFVLIARYFIGLNCGILVTAIALYLSETSIYVYRMTRLKQAEKTDCQSEKKTTDKEKRNPLKENLFTILILVLSCSSLITQGIASIASSIPALNPYRWAGWFMVILSTVLVVIHSLAFKPFDREVPCNGKICSSKKAACSGQTRCLMSRAKSLSTYGALSLLLLYAVVMACSYTAASSYALVDTLLNPILSDHFGFRVQDESYALLGAAICQSASGVLNLIFKSFKVKTKNLLIFWIVLALIGALLMADWQSIGHDRCRDGFPKSYNTTGIRSNETEHMKGRLCEQLSTDAYQCLWNPDSQVTGHYCPECFKVCRDSRKSLSFLQFSIGLVAHSLALPPFAVSVTVLLSEIVPLKHQGMVFGVMNAVIAVARIVQPLWMDAAYESSGKYTHVAMATVALQLTLVLAAVLALYKRLEPVAQEEEEEEEEEAVEEGAESDSDIELAVVIVRSGAEKYHLISQKSGACMEE